MKLVEYLVDNIYDQDVESEDMSIKMMNGLPGIIISYNTFKGLKKDLEKIVNYNIYNDPKSKTDLYNSCEFEYELRKRRGDTGLFLIINDGTVLIPYWFRDFKSMDETDVKYNVVDYIDNTTINDIKKALNI